MRYYFMAFKNYFNFEGRASRKEFWFFVLFDFLVSFTLIFLDGFLGTFNYEPGRGIISTAYSLFAFIPHLGVTVRRLHDIDLRGAWILVSLIPFVGWFVFLLLLVKSDAKANKYGEPPKSLSRQKQTSVENENNSVINTHNDGLNGAPERTDRTFVEESTEPVNIYKNNFCRKCGTKLNEGSQFCHKCGTPVVDCEAINK